MTLLTRRDFVRISLSTAGGLAVGFHLPVSGALDPGQQSAPSAVEINAWITIDPDDSIVIRVARSEMGQGVMTSLPMIVAEELEADWRKVKVEHVAVNRQIRTNEYGEMGTFASQSVSRSREPLQYAGAQARMRLIKAAAEKWVVDPADCYADYHRVYDKSGRQSFSYGELAAAAAMVNVVGVRIKTSDEFNILGLPTKRLDVPSKVDGTAQYGIDVRLPNMAYAAVVHCPVLGGTVQSMRYNVIRHMPGVLKAVRMESSVAVVAETFWQAKKALDALPVFWDIGDSSKTFSNTFKSDFFDEFSKRGELLKTKGNIVNLMDYSDKTIESDYVVPYLAHAAMEPLNCTVHIAQERVDVWVGHQDPETAVDAVARISGKDRDNIYLHNCLLGGGFGRRSHTDFVEEATLIALEIARPVQMIWTREEDMRGGAYRPMSAMRFKAGFDLDKQLVALTNHSVTHSIKFDQTGELKEVDSSSIDGLVNHPYSFPAYEFTHTRKNTHMTSWWWRSVGHSINAYGMECFVDEMAAAANMDPLAYRRQLLVNRPEYLEVLDVVEQKTDWGKRTRRRGSAMGLAIHESAGTICAQVAEVRVVANGKVKVDKITAVVDCGNLVNPLTAQEQIEGSIVFGLTAALYGKLTIENGRVLEDNIDTYEMIHMEDMPEIEIHWALSGGDKWGGLGEPATPVVAPAVCNALYKITGKRIRTLPIKDYYLTAV